MTPTSPPSRFRNFLETVASLRTAPRELWVIYAAYVLENIAYGLGASSVLSLWMSSDLGFSDTKAGAMITTYSSVVTLATALVGSLTDAAGIRRTFLLGFFVCLISRIIMTVAGAPAIAMNFGLFPLAVGIALLQPVMAAAMRRYSNTRQRTLVFSLYYTLMNVGFLIAAYLFDLVRNTLGEKGSWTVPIWGESLSTYRVLIFGSVLFTLPGLILAWVFLRDGVEVTDQGVTIKPSAKADGPKLNPIEALLKTVRETAVKTAQIFLSLWKEPAFYRFLVFMLLIVGVKLIGYHMAFTFPKFGLRELGEGAPIGRLYGVLNSAMIIILVPICGAISGRFTAYRMVAVGTLIAASSVFFLAVPVHWFKPLADGWLGDLIAHRWLNIPGDVNPWYVSIFLFVVTLSLGEVLWSPRLYEYAAAIAPKGQEASYMALSVLPYFGAKFVVGTMSGLLLSHFCPAQGPRNSAGMWLVIGCMAMITPVGILLLRRYIQVQEAGREPETRRG